MVFIHKIMIKVALEYLRLAETRANRLKGQDEHKSVPSGPSDSDAPAERLDCTKRGAAPRQACGARLRSGARVSGVRCCNFNQCAPQSQSAMRVAQRRDG